jgi:hypothetical protein
MSAPNLLELAKQGDVRAIATLLNRSLEPNGMRVKTGVKNDCLQIMVEAATVPNQQTIVAFIHKSMMSLGAASIQKVKIYGKQAGEDFPAWNKELDLTVSSEANLTKLAAQGDLNAINSLIGLWLNVSNLKVETILDDGCLQAILESSPLLDPDRVVPIICDRLQNLNIPSCQRVAIYGREAGNDFPDWHQARDLDAKEDLATSKGGGVKSISERSTLILKKDESEEEG